MLLRSKAAYVIATGAIIALTTSAADARYRYTPPAPYPYYSGTYDYAGPLPPSTGTFVYGANRAPYGWNQNYANDFQLQGHN